MGTEGIRCPDHGGSSPCIGDPGYPGRHQHGGAQDHVTELAHRGVRESELEVILQQRKERTNNNRDDCCGYNDVLETQIRHQTGAVEIQHNAKQPENTGIHDSNGMQEPTDGGRCDHGAGQPPVYRDKRCLDGKTRHEEEKGKPGKAGSDGCDAGIAAGNKVKGVSHGEQGHDPREDCNSPGLGVNKIFPPCCKRFLRLDMDNEGICGDGKDVVEHKQ